MRKDKGKNDVIPEMMIAQLLFRDKPKSAPVETVRAALEKRVGDIGNSPYYESSAESRTDMIMLPVPKYKVILQDAPDGMPPMACFLGPVEFSAEKIDELKRSQFWDVNDGNELVNSCKWCVAVHGMLSPGLNYKEQAELLLAQVGAALECYPECCAVYIDRTGKLTLPEYFFEGEEMDLTSRFIRLYVNARFFRITDTDDMVVDTLGFNSFLGADVQMHFHGINPDNAVNYIYNIASYQFENEFPIKSGETVDSIDDNGNIQWEPQWVTQYENSLIEPVRTVLDINCGEFASQRE